MSINGFRILWCNFQTEKNKDLSFTFPISLYIFQELLDSILDLLIFVCLFLPKAAHPNRSSPYNIYTVKELVEMTIKSFDSLTEDEPYELVDVTAEKIKVSIKIK